MKALLLAAGKGTRISRYLGGNPKCTVNIGDEILIHYTVSLLKKKGINDIGIVVGYQDNIIKEVLSDEKAINFFYNPFYEITNSLASAWFAGDFIDDDMLIMNADVFLEEALLDDILSCKISPVLFSDETRKEEADFKLFYKDGLLIDYGKELEVERTTGEYIGVVTFNKSFVETFKTNMCKMIKEKKYSMWWENILYELIGKQDINVKNIENRFWAEVDYIEDYERILKFRKYNINYNIAIEKKK